MYQLPMGQPPSCSTRLLALGGLAAYGVTALCVVLTLAFPASELPSDTGGHFLHIPPQAILGALVGLFTILLAVVLAGICIASSLISRQWVWPPVFSLLSLAGLLGPVLLLMHVDISQEAWTVVALISSVGVLLVFVAALLYTLPSRRPGQA